MKKKLAQAAVFCFFYLLSSASQNIVASASLGRDSMKSAQAPDFTLETIAGKSVSLKNLRGKDVILFFFTTWCPYCRQKIPALAKDYEKYRREGIELLVIDGGETRAKVSSFIAKQSLPFDILLDSDLRTAEAYGVIGVPTFVLISKDGRVVYEGNDLPHDYKELLTSGPQKV